MVLINSTVRLQAKTLLSKSTLRLFIISTVSFILRWGYAAINISGLILFLRSDTLASLLKSYDPRLVYTLAGVVYSLFFMIMLTAVCAIKTGERFIYFTRAEGSKGRFLLLFKFIGIKKGLRALRLCLTVNAMKLLWLIYFLLPTALCSACILYLYNFARISAPVLYTLLTGASLLFAVSMVMWRTAVLRYEGASYYTCLRDISVRNAIKKSIRHTDGVLTEGVMLEYSLLGWLLSCVLIFPLFYSVPYIKLCKAVFTTEAVSRKASRHTTYAVNHLHISGKHINQSS